MVLTLLGFLGRDDDFCLNLMDAAETSDIFELIVERHRRSTTIVTTNREPPGEWLAAMADQLLAADLERFEDAVNGMVADQTSQQQFDAMVSFAYNLGESALRGSTLLRMHNSQDYNGAAGQFGRWNHAGGRELPGLTRRRAAEAAVYANGDYGGDSAPAAA